MLSRRIVLSLVAVVALVLSSAGSAEAGLFGGCGCHRGGCGGGFLRGLFHRHHCCSMNDCGCGCQSSCDSGCGCDGGCDGGCGCGEATESGAAPATPEAAPAAPAAPEKSA
jgi:hypothetical protein